MNKDPNKIDQLVRDASKKFTASPPPELWDNIVNASSDKKPTYGVHRTILQWSALAASLIIAFFMGYLFSLEKNNTKNEHFFSLQQQNLTIERNTDKGYYNTPYFMNQLFCCTISLPQISSPAIRENHLAQTSHLFTDNLSAINEIIIDDDREQTSSFSTTNTAISQLTHHNTASIPISSPKQLLPIRKQHFDSSYAGLIKSPSDRYTYDNSPEEKAKKDRWSLLVLAAPGQSYTSTQGSVQKVIPSGSFGNGNNSTESNLFAYSGGIGMNYKLTHKLSVQSGIQYTAYHQTNSDALLYNPSPGTRTNEYRAVTSAGRVTINTSSIQSNKIPKPVLPSADTIGPGDVDYFLNRYTIDQQMQYMEIPFIVQYKALDKKISVEIEGGINTGILVSNKVRLSNNDQAPKNASNSDLNNIIYHGVMGIGVSYKLSEKIKLYLTPTYRIALTPLNNTPGYKNRPSSLLWNTGFRYTF